jgi:hypothetical protein
VVLRPDEEILSHLRPRGADRSSSRNQARLQRTALEIACLAPTTKSRKSPEKDEDLLAGVGMVAVYKNGVLIGEFETVVEAFEFANADAEVCGHEPLTWSEVENAVPAC